MLFKLFILLEFLRLKFFLLGAILEVDISALVSRVAIEFLSTLCSYFYFIGLYSNC
jgi:hypothetical protein